MADHYILIETTETPSGGVAEIGDDELAEFYVHTGVVETFEGTSGYGADIFADPFTLDPADSNGCFVEGKRLLVRASDGQQVVSSSQVFCRPVNAPRFTPDSRFTWGGVESRVISVAVHDSGGLDLPDHIEVFLK